ncbi:MAG TPA: hypothetical protein VGF95_01255 [Solirubrobacteraceae bacterium]
MLLCACLAQQARATTAAKLEAAFLPDQLGSRTTLEFGFSFSAPPGQVPPPLTQIELRYPNNLGIALSRLGIAECTAKILETSGPRGCPADSVMGYGVVYTGIVLGSSTVTELAPITIFRAMNSEHLALLFYAEGTHPVVTDIVFPGLLLSAAEPFGGKVSIGVPLVSTLPGAPYVSVIHLHATIGPREVTYYEKVGGITLAYKPAGILLPPTCPPKGFPFSAVFTFSDGSRTRAQTDASCPAQTRSALPAKQQHGRRHRHAKRADNAA